MAQEKRERTGIMLCHILNEEKLKTWKKPYICQPKIDGFRCRASLSKDGTVLYSSTGREIYTAPLVNISLGLVRNRTGIEIELDGELVIPGENFQSISRMINRNHPHPEDSKIKYIIFDVISGDIQSSRLQELFDFPDGQYHMKIKWTYANSLVDILDIMGACVRLGQEGVIVRNKDGFYES